MRRRDVIISLLGGAAFACSVGARAQQPGRVPRIGFLGAATPMTTRPWTAAFVERLRELGWSEGRNVAIEYRWAEGRTERFAEIAAEFVSLGVDVIVTHSSPPVLAAKQVTSAIPIVFATAGDPVGTGLVTSLARPGGNVTGVSNQTGDLAAKRLELLRIVTPHLGRVALLGNAGNPAAVADMRGAETAARALGLDVITVEIRRAEDLAPGFATLKGRADALYVVADALANTNRATINTLALDAGLPTMHGFREYVQTGGLMSYGPSLPDGFRRAADYVDKILRGAKPSDLPVEQPTKFDLVFNLRTAKALGLTTSESFLLRADEVIE